MLRVPLVVLALSITFMGPSRADFREDLAKQLNADPSYFVLNLPPKGAVWPGTIFSDAFRFTVSAAKKSPRLVRGSPYSFRQSVVIGAQASAGAGLASVFNIGLDVNSIATTTLEVRDARIYELPYDDIKNIISANRSKAKQPSVIYRSYEGTMFLRLTKKAEVNVGGWTTLRRLVTQKAHIEGESAEEIVLSVSEPFVFAFEVAQSTTFAKACKTKSDLDCKKGTVAVGAAPSVVLGPSTGQITGQATGQATTGAWAPSDLTLVRVPAVDFEAAHRDK
jgi:hypothetical protein